MTILQPCTRSFAVMMVLACGLGAGCSKKTPPPPGASSEPGTAAPAGLLSVGAKAPEVVGLDAAGKTVRLSEHRGKALVYFYPKDDTPGCTKEAQGLRDAFGEYQKADIAIFGVSEDEPASHEAFRKKHELPFVLVADTDGAIAKAFGVPVRLGFAKRVSFLVGEDGRVLEVWDDVEPTGHARSVLSSAKKH